MSQDIIAGVLCVIAVAAGVWGWWIENRGTCENTEKMNIEECEECGNEKN